jgi:hypothetical protein
VAANHASETADRTARIQRIGGTVPRRLASPDRPFGVTLNVDRWRGRRNARVAGSTAGSLTISNIIDVATENVGPVKSRTAASCSRRTITNAGRKISAGAATGVPPVKATAIGMRR